MLRDIAKKYYIDKKFNCAEAILMAINEQYNLKLSDKEMNLITAFGGGMGSGKACGTLTGAVASLGLILDSKSPEFRAECKEFVQAFEHHFGNTDCSTIKEEYKTPETRCLKAVAETADLFEKMINEKLGIKNNIEEIPADEIKRVKGLGFLNNKGTRNFNCRVITRNGKINYNESKCISEAAHKFGNGEVAFTTRLTVEIQGIPYENINPLIEFLDKNAGLKTGGTGSKVRPVVSCKGTTCQYGLYDTYKMSEKAHELFYIGYNSVKLPHKFKIAFGGCPNNCVKPNLNDIGVVGQRIPAYDEEKCKGCKKCMMEAACPIHACSMVNGKNVIDKELCNNCGRCVGKCPFHLNDNSTYGFRIYIGGRWGKKIALGKPLGKVFTSEQEVFDVLEKAILLFREQGITGERFADTINRLGFENVEKQLLSNDILDRKEQILGAELHLVGGATC